MEFGAENSTRLTWRTSPELLLNEESLVDVITKLRTQVQVLEQNELLSGTALPAWLLRALTDVANSVDAVVECQALHDQVGGLQKEVLELRHEMLLQQSSASSGAGYNPSPLHRQSTGGMRASAPRTMTLPRGPGLAPVRGTSTGELTTTTDEVDAMVAATAAVLAPECEPVNYQAILKPVWDAIHKQTNEFSTLKSSFLEAKDTVTRLQSEIKRRDAVIQARNNKHEAVVQSQVEKLNESLRACVTRNDLIGAEQRIAQQMKQDRQNLMTEVDQRSNKMLEDLLASRADQEDVNSMNAETIQDLSRKQTRTEEQVLDLMKKHSDGQQSISEMKLVLADAVDKVDANNTTISEFKAKVASFENTQSVVRKITEDMKSEAESNDNMRAELEERMIDKIGENVAVVRGEINAVNATVTELVNMNLDSEIRALGTKVDMLTLNTSDCARKIAHQQKQLTVNEEQSRAQFTQAFDSIDRVLTNMSTISEESMRQSYNLAQTTEHVKTLQIEVTDYKKATDRTLHVLNRTVMDIQGGLEKHVKSTENEISAIKNQLFHVEDTNSNLKREIETIQKDASVTLHNQHKENTSMKSSLETLFQARDELSARQDSAQAQMFVLQAENRSEIQAATTKLVAVVDKESDRVEALYASFQEKQEQFADTVARSSIRNMDLVDMNRELDRMSEIFVTECWKFEISARSSNKTSARLSENNNNAFSRKLFNERQQQLLAKNCQFFADVIVARAEYEALHAGCNKETKSQNRMGESMLDAQGSIVEKMKAKIQTKIMNNKNIGEQFDKSTLDRRELYIETLSNMIDASIIRRTMSGDGSGRPGDSGDAFREDRSGGSFLETQRLVSTSTGMASSRRKLSSRQPSVTLSSPGIGSDLDSSRIAFSPASSHVYRAGFRLPKAAQTPPGSPDMLAAMLKPSPSDLALNEKDESPIDQGDRPPSTSEGLQGWATEDGGSGGMSKSISLPTLRQQ